MRNTRFGFMTLVALSCFLLLSLGWAQQGTSGSSQSGQSMSQGENSSQISSSSKQFLDHMAKDSQGEVQVAQLGVQKASNPQVKAYAQKLVSDHQNLDQQMQSFMSQNSMSMPQPLTQDQQQLQSRLQSLSGSQFDKAFVNAAVKDHTKDVAEVQQHIQSAQNQQVKQLLETALPVLQQHLEMAKQLQSQLGSGSSSRQQ